MKFFFFFEILYEIVINILHILVTMGEYKVEYKDVTYFKLFSIIPFKTYF